MQHLNWCVVYLSFMYVHIMINMVRNCDMYNILYTEGMFGESPNQNGLVGKWLNSGSNWFYFGELL